jgi:hypothetical protein
MKEAWIKHGMKNKSRGVVATSLIVSLGLSLIYFVALAFSPNPEAMLTPWCPTKELPVKSLSDRSPPDESETPRKETSVLLS